MQKLTICAVSLLEAAIVGDILALGVDAVEVHVDSVRGVVTVLPDDALGLLEELELRLGLPPVLQVAYNGKKCKCKREMSRGERFLSLFFPLISNEEDFFAHACNIRDSPLNF